MTYCYVKIKYNGTNSTLNPLYTQLEIPLPYRRKVYEVTRACTDVGLKGKHVTVSCEEKPSVTELSQLTSVSQKGVITQTYRTAW